MQKKQPFRTTTAKFNANTKKIKIDANSTDFYPLYLKYLFEYLKVPQDATIIFNDRTIKGGVKAWLEETANNK